MAAEADIASGGLAPTKATRGFDRPLNLTELLAIFRRRLRLFLVVFGLVALACTAGVMMLKPRYTAVATVKIDPNARSLVDQSGASTWESSQSAFVDTEMAVARSRGVAEEVVKQLNLTSDPDFGGHPAAARDPVRREELFRGVTDAALGGLDVQRADQTYLVSVAYTADDPKKAAMLANAFSDAYISSSIKLRNDTMRAQADALQSGLDHLSREAQAASEAAASYRARAGLVDASNGTVVQQQATSTAGQLSSAEAQLAATRAELNEAMAQRGSGREDSVVGVLNSPVIQDLRGRRAELVRQQNEISTRYGPRHPEFIKIQQQLDGIDVQVREESGRVISALQAKERASQAEVGALRSQLGRFQGQLAASSRVEAAAQGLDQEAQAKQEVYRQYNLAQQQANQQKTLQQPQGVIVGRAVVPTSPSFPNKSLFTLLGLMLGGVLGLASVFVAEALDPGVLNVDDAEQIFGQAVLTSIPLIPTKQLKQAGSRAGPESYAVVKPMSAFAEAFRRIRSTLVLASEPARVICLTSALPAEGKSVSSFSFARVLALGGARTIIVDCDLRRSSLARMSRQVVDNGLIEVISGQAQLDQAIIKDDLTDLAILQLSQTSFSPEDVIGSEAFADLIRQLRARYEYVVLDTPPVLAVADARVVASLSDAVLFICRWSRTPRGAAVSALQNLQQDGANIAGVVLNMVDMSAKGVFSANDPSSYMKSYQSYYAG